MATLPGEAWSFVTPETDVVKLSLQTIAGEGSTPGHNLTAWADPTLHRRKDR